MSIQVEIVPQIDAQLLERILEVVAERAKNGKEHSQDVEQYLTQLNASITIKQIYKRG